MQLLRSTRERVNGNVIKFLLYKVHKLDMQVYIVTFEILPHYIVVYREMYIQTQKAIESEREHYI